MPSNAGQSVQLIALWCRCIGLPFQWTNAYNWWDDADENFTEHWSKINRPQSSDQLPSPGDIIVFSGSLPGSEGYGHLSIFVENNETDWIGFDSNWGGKSAHLQSHNWAYVVGWFSPVNKSVLEAEIPTSIALPTASDPYDTQPIEPQIVVIKNEAAALYNLNDVSWDSFNSNVISRATAGQEITVTALAKHRLGGTFLMPDVDISQGYDINDCRGYIIGHPEPVPEDEHLEISPVGNIAPPLKAPSTTDTIQVRDPIIKYRTMSDAALHNDGVGQLSSGKYYVYKHLNDMMNVTSTIGQAGYWINPRDLQPKKLVDWHKLESFSKARYFTAVMDAPVIDLDGNGKELGIKEEQPILIIGFFRGPDGRVYAAPDVTYNGEDRKWYGIEADLVRPYITPTEVMPDELPENLPMHVKIISVITKFKYKKNKEKI